MQKARRHNCLLRPLVGTWFQGLFHSSVRGSFHLSLTVLVHYRSLESIQPYGMVPVDSYRISRVPHYSGYYRLRRVSYTGLSPSLASLSKLFYSCLAMPKCSPTTPTLPKQHWFGLFPFRSPLLWESLLFSLPMGTQMFQFPTFAHSLRCVTESSSAGLPHSEILGLADICSYPKLFAAYHVLLRLREPRHPPCALSYFLSLPYKEHVYHMSFSV